MSEKKLKKKFFFSSKISLEPFAPDETPLFQNIKALNLNMPSQLCKEILSMLSYYGGEPINSGVQLVSENEALNSESLSATGATHAFSISFDSTTRLVESSVSTSIRIVTPDWLVDSIEAGKLLCGNGAQCTGLDGRGVDTFASAAHCP